MLLTLDTDDEKTEIVCKQGFWENH